MSAPDSAPTSDRLHALLFGDWKAPKRISQMAERTTQDGKYFDLPEYSYTPAHMRAHLDGRETYAVTLGLLNEARAGCKDYDEADEAEILAALGKAAARGITAAAFLMSGNNGNHRGGHLWVFYNRAYPIADIRAQLRTIPRAGDGEDYPSGNPIRIPFGYHKVKRTRGVLVLQDGRRFRLDNPAELDAAIEAFLALPLNGKPEPAPLGDVRVSGGAWGDAYRPDEWNDLPDGGPLWRSPYIKAAAERRPDLARLLRGERVTITKKDDTLDDSDSAQVAALAWNLSSAYVDRQQARAIADYLKPQLRPGRTLEHYRAHFDAEWERYCPKSYQPRTIRILGTADSEAPAALPPAEHKPPRKSRARKDRPQKVAGALGYLAWLQTQAGADGVVMLSQRECAEKLGCSVRTVKRYEAALGEKVERDPLVGRQHGRLWVRGDNIISEAPIAAPADVVIADAPEPHPVAANAVPASMQEEHPAPLGPDLAAWWEAQPPVPAEDWGSPTERQALADELLAVGNVGAAWWIVGAPSRTYSPTNVPALPDAVCEAFDVYADRPLIIGKKGKPRRAPLRKRTIAAYVASNYPALKFGDDDLDAAIEQERRRRKLADLPTLALGALKAEIRLAEHLADKSQAAGDSAWRWWLVYRNAARAELAKRPAEPAKRARKVCEALPDVRETAAQLRTEWLDLADDARLDLRAKRTGRATRASAGGVPPLPATAPPEPITDQARNLIAFLKARPWEVPNATTW